MTPTPKFFFPLLFCHAFVALASLSTGQTPENPATIGNSAEGAKLAAALQAAYAGGARDITITPGIYILPAHQMPRDSIKLEGWKDTIIRARGVTIICEERTKPALTLDHCENVTLEGAILRFSHPAFTQGRIVGKGSDASGDFFDWQIDAGYSEAFDLPNKCTFNVADQATRQLKIGSGDVGFSSFEPLGKSRFRLRKVNGRPGSAAVNDWLITRIQPCTPVVLLNRSGRCTMRGVTL